AEKELPVGILLTHHAAEGRASSRALARSFSRRSHLEWPIPEPRLPLRALFRRAPLGGIPLSVEAQPPSAQHSYFPCPGCREPSLLLFECGYPQGRGG